MKEPEKKEGAEAAVVAEAPVVEEVEVTMYHSSFGSHAFRAEKGKLAAAMSAQLSVAERAADVRKQVEEIDAEQNKLAVEVREVNARIEAASVLKDSAHTARAEADLKRLEERNRALSEKRGKVMEAK